MDSNFLLELYQQQAKMIYHYLLKNGCSHEDAEDIVQESYTKFIIYQSGVPSDKALAYIFTIAMNEFKKMLRKNGKERVLTINEDLFWQNFAHDETTEELVLQTEIRREIGTVLVHMSETYQQLLLLKYELDFSYKEIAFMLGMKIETVRTYLYRARQQFQKIWRDQSERME